MAPRRPPTAARACASARPRSWPASCLLLATPGQRARSRWICELSWVRRCVPRSHHPAPATLRQKQRSRSHPSTPQAYPHASSSELAQQSDYFSTLLNEHFLPTIPALRISDKKAFVPTLHLTLLSADGGVLSTLALAARAALADLSVPRTKEIGWEGVSDEHDMAGIKGAVGGAKGKGRARARGADDWDLDGGEAPLDGRDELPVLVTLFLVPASDAVFVDATPQEEAACPTRLHALVRPNGRICGARLEGQDGIDAARVRPLFEEAQRIGIDLAAALNADLP
ncbi:hypothetical protein VHUM_02576 [Vanrija humicola]|uniref:Ribosomal RNA-processing protein 42 n=1 Tax=Vanrija humicola TaxID=5417 RepID=A0A7D8Z2T9_VANHU|nr:hypothetical protein VHUM_02576 [Vanrija humicola]